VYRRDIVFGAETDTDDATGESRAKPPRRSPARSTTASRVLTG
jgi:hypothetical protein